MEYAYPEMKDFAFLNVQKCYAVIIDNACDPKITSVCSISNRFSDKCTCMFFKFSKILEIIEMFKNVML